MTNHAHTHLTEVLARLDRARGALRSSVDAIPPSLQRTRPAPDRWSAVEVIEHLSLVERMFGGRLANAVETARSGLSTEATARVPLPDAIEQRMANRVTKRDAPDAAKPTGTVDLDSAWAALESHHTALRALLAGAAGLALSQVVLDHPAFGSLTVYQWIELMAAHEGRHTEQIREIASVLTPNSQAPTPN